MLKKIRSIPSKKIFKWITVLCLLIIVLIIGSNYWIINSTKHQLYADIYKIPANDVALLLGANKKNNSRE